MMRVLEFIESIAVWCIVLQCAAMCCSVLQRILEDGESLGVD